MATTILDKLSPSAEIGASLGGGLSSGLQSLITAKLGQMQKQAGMTGVMPGQQAQALSYLPDDILKTLLPQIQKNQQFQQGLRQFDTQPAPVDPTQQTQPGQLEQLIQPDQQPIGFSDQDVVNRVATQDQQRKVDENARINKAGKAAYISSFGNPLVVQKAQEQERNRIQKQSLQEEKLASSETAKWRDKVEDSAEFAKTDLRNLKIQNDLVKTNKLIGNKELVFLDIVGDKLGLSEEGKSAFKSGESQIFEKLSVPYFRNLKTTFGSRPTQWDAQQLKKSFPSLYQSNAGKKVIIKFMEQDSNIAIKTNDIKRNVIRANGGRVPRNLRELTDNNIESWKDAEYKKLTNKVSNILAKTDAPDAPAQNFKGKSVEMDNGLVFTSDGSKWKLKLDSN